MEGCGFKCVSGKAKARIFAHDLIKKFLFEFKYPEHQLKTQIEKYYLNFYFIFQTSLLCILEHQLKTHRLRKHTAPEEMRFRCERESLETFPTSHTDFSY